MYDRALLDSDFHRRAEALWGLIAAGAGSRGWVLTQLQSADETRIEDSAGVVMHLGADAETIESLLGLTENLDDGPANEAAFAALPRKQRHQILASQEGDNKIDPDGFPEPIFGGESWPIGWTLGLIGSDYQSVCRWWSEKPFDPGRPLPVAMLADHLLALAPLQTPPTRRLFVDLHPGWTAYFDNSISGGDPVSVTATAAVHFMCRGILASHSPRSQRTFPATQWHIYSPEQNPKMIRTIDAGIFDSGRWSFRTSGEPQPYEDLSAYDNRFVRDRLTRSMVFDYMRAEGVDPAWSEGSFRATVFEKDISAWKSSPRTLSIEEARARRAAA